MLHEPRQARVPSKASAGGILVMAMETATAMMLMLMMEKREIGEQVIVMKGVVLFYKGESIDMKEAFLHFSCASLHNQRR